MFRARPYPHKAFENRNSILNFSFSIKLFNGLKITHFLIWEHNLQPPSRGRRIMKYKGRHKPSRKRSNKMNLYQMLPQTCYFYTMAKIKCWMWKALNNENVVLYERLWWNKQNHNCNLQLEEPAGHQGQFISKKLCFWIRTSTFL